MLTIVYRSESTSRLPYMAMADICLKSARNNQKLGVTGFLVEWEGIFLQALEGDAEVVDALYARIAADPRHQRIELLLREQNQVQANFGFWAMNFGRLDNPTFWQAVFGSPMDVECFSQRSHEADFALDVLARAYMHACIVADVDPAIRKIVHANIPCFAPA